MSRVREVRIFPQVKRHIASNSVFYQLLGSMVLLCVVIVPLLTTVLLQTFEKTLQDQVFETQQQNLQLMAGSMDFRAEYANYLMQAAQQNPEIAALLYKKDDPATADLRSLTTFRVSVPHLISIYVYNRYNDWIYCSSEMTFYTSRAAKDFDDQDFVSMLRNLDDYNIYTPYLRYIDTPVQKRGEYVYTYFLYDTYLNGTKDNVIALNFSMEWVESAVQYLRNDNASSQISIVTRDRQIVYSDQMDQIGATMAEALPDEVFTSPSGYTFLNTEDGEQMVVYATPSRTGYQQWVFLSFVNYSELMLPMEQMLRTVLLIALLALLAYLLLGIILSRRVYSPIQKVFDRVETLMQDQSRKQELERGIFLRHLFLGELSDAPSVLEEQSHEHGITHSPDNEVRIILVSVDHVNDFLYKFRKNTRYADEKIVDAIQKCFSSVSDAFYFVKMQDGSWAVLLFLPAVANPSQSGASNLLLESLNEELSDLDITVSMAISDPGQSMSDVPYLVAEAREELAYRFVLGTRRLISTDQIQTLGMGKYRYPLELEAKVISALFGGKKQETMEAYANFVEQIQGFNVQDMRLSLMMLASSMKRSCNDVIVDNSGILLLLDTFPQQIQSLDTLEEVNKLFYTLFHKIAEMLQESAAQKHQQTVEQIQMYVQQNYCNISFSMSEVADAMDMSAAYLGRLFKQATGVTFTEYLSNLRLQKACAALLTTDKTVSTIASETGFTNSSYFYIVFKKRFGCTPSQYRQQNGITE